MSKNIWIWNHYASDMFRNRGGRHYWFAKNLIERGYKVTIFCSNTFHNSTDIIPIEGNDLYKVDEKDGVKFVFIKTSPFNGNGFDRIKNMYEFYRNIKKVSNKIIRNKEKPDYILASSVHPLTMLAGVQIGKKHNIPCVSEVRDLWPEAIFQFGYLKESNPVGLLLTKGEKYIYEKSDAIVFTKPGDRDYILEKEWDIGQGGKINLDKVFYINNGIDLEVFNIQKENNVINDEDLSKQQFNITYTGTINPVNNIDLILDTAKKLDNSKEIIFLVYGSGSEENRIKDRIINENISNVKFKGRVDKKYIPFILSKSSINLLNYSQKQYNWKRGNSSNKLFEYLASGKPVLSTVKMGYSIIDEYNCGIELNNPSPNELAEIILEIKGMSEQKYHEWSDNALKTVQNFDFSNLTDDLEKVISYVGNKK